MHVKFKAKHEFVSLKPMFRSTIIIIIICPHDS